MCDGNRFGVAVFVRWGRSVNSRIGPFGPLGVQLKLNDSVLRIHYESGRMFICIAICNTTSYREMCLSAFRLK